MTLEVTQGHWAWCYSAKYAIAMNATCVDADSHYLQWYLALLFTVFNLSQLSAKHT